MTIYRTLLASTALSLAAAVPAHALIVGFDATIGNGVYAGLVGTGTLTYDETLLTNSGFESLGLTTFNADYADPTLSISVSSGPVSFSTEDDIDYPDYPNFEFVNGELDFVNYWVEDGVNGVDLAQYGVFAFSFENLFVDDNDRLQIDVQVQYLSQVPLPAGGALLLTALGIGAWAGRKRKG